MKNKKRIFYGITIMVVILLGLYSRSDAGMPSLFREYGGDVLWAVMIYFIIAFLILDANKKRRFWIAVLFCTAIECSQLLSFAWLVYLRTTIAHYLLGQGFLWSDLGCYLLGCCIAYMLDTLYLVKEKRQ